MFLPFPSSQAVTTCFAKMAFIEGSTAKGNLETSDPNHDRTSPHQNHGVETSPKVNVTIDLDDESATMSSGLEATLKVSNETLDLKTKEELLIYGRRMILQARESNLSTTHLLAQRHLPKLRKIVARKKMQRSERRKKNRERKKRRQPWQECALCHCTRELWRTLVQIHCLRSSNCQPAMSLLRPRDEPMDNSFEILMVSVEKLLLVRKPCFTLNL